MNKPFSQSCENNKQSILTVLKQYLIEPGCLLEIGSGTGQHSAYFPNHLPHIQWQPSDVRANLKGIQRWCEETPAVNRSSPIELDVTSLPYNIQPADYLFSANTLHIMSWTTVTEFFSRIPTLLKTGGYAFFYGPFKYQGNFTSTSNAQFDAWLKQQDSEQGIRDFEAIKELTNLAGLEFVTDISMPANNQVLIWKKINRTMSPEQPPKR